MRQQVNARGGFGIPTNASSNGSHNSFLQRIGLKLHAYSSGIEFVFGNIRSSGSGGGLLNGESAITLTLAVEIGADVFPVYWPNGARALRIEPGAFVRTAPCPVVLPPGTGTAILRMHGKWDSPPSDFPIANGAMAEAGYDSNTRGVDLADETLTSGMPTLISTFSVICPPWAVIGLAPPRAAVLAIGDSNRSWSTSGLSSATIPFINLGADGYTLNAFMGTDFPRLVVAQDAGITHALVTVAGGDVTGGAGSATLIARANSVATILERFGIKAVFATTPPKTNAANTAVNSSSIWAAVRDYNAYIRASNGVGYGYFDLFDVWGDRDTGLWRTDLGTPTDDGTHANAVMHTAAAAALAAVAEALFV